MTIFDALRGDHDTQRRLIDQLLETEGDSDDRRRWYAELKQELAAHAAAEERSFYVPLMEHDETQEKSRHSVAEHHELDELVEQLDGYDLSAPAWLETARELAHRLVHHLDEEEHEVFQMAGKVLSDEQKTQLGTDYVDDMDRRRAD
jgi:hemerythrin-like domain-containing protein